MAAAALGDLNVKTSRLKLVHTKCINTFEQLPRHRVEVDLHHSATLPHPFPSPRRPRSTCYPSGENSEGSKVGKLISRHTDAAMLLALPWSDLTFLLHSPLS